MWNKFSLSFGIVLVVAGIFSIFFEVDSTVLLGISISAFALSMLNPLIKEHDSKTELLYVIPLGIFVLFSCFSNALMNVTFIKVMLNSKMATIITFLSFGSLFISGYNAYHKKLIDFISKSINITESSSKMAELIIECRKKQIKNKTKVDKYSNELINNLEEICLKIGEKNNIELQLLKMNKRYFSLEEISEAYIKCNKVLTIDERSHDKKNKKNND